MLINSYLIFSITFSKKLTTSCSLWSLCLLFSRMAKCTLLYSFYNRDIIFYSWLSLYLFYSLIISDNYSICELNCAYIFFVISFVEFYSLYIYVYRLFRCIYRLENYLIAYLPAELLLVLAEVSSIKKPSRATLIFFSVSFLS